MNFHPSSLDKTKIGVFKIEKLLRDLEAILKQQKERIEYLETKEQEGKELKNKGKQSLFLEILKKGINKREG